MKKLLKILLLAIVFALLFQLAALASDSEISDKAGAYITGATKTATSVLYRIIRTATTVVAVAFLAFGAIQIMTGTEREIQRWGKYVLLCIVVIAVVWLAPSIVKGVEHTTLSSTSALQTEGMVQDVFIDLGQP